MLLDVRHIFTVPYFPLSQFLIPVLTQYKVVFFGTLCRNTTSTNLDCHILTY